MKGVPLLHQKSLRRVILRLPPWAALAFATLVFALPIFAQGVQGTIQGGVFDQSGGVIAGAMVTVTDVARGISKVLTTDSAGEYVAVDLTPGTYTVRGEAKGFQVVEHTNVIVEVGRNIRVDLTLQPGTQTQTITVTAEVPAVDTTDATLGGTVNNQAINALPLNGRNYQRLLGLRPGVVAAIGSGTGSESSNGLRGGENITLIDGLVTMAQQSGGSVLNTSYHQGDSTSLLPVDAIQEFNIEQNPKAEYGWRDGAVQNIGVKSGTNSLHGTAYAFGRDTPWDAANYFVGRAVPISLEQYGATAGGKIIKDRVFWFLGYEDLNYTVGDSSTPTIPISIATGNSTFSMVDACNAAKAKVINPLSAQIAGLNHWQASDPAPCTVSPASSTFENLFPYNASTSNFFSPPITTVNPIHNGIAKIDYNVNATNHISGMFFVGYANSTVQLDPNQLAPQWENLQRALVHDEAATWVWTPNSIWVNELRGGVALLHFQAQAVDHNVNPADPWPTGYGIPSGITNPLYFGMPKLRIKTFTGFLGQGQREGNRGPEGTADIVDHVSHLHGKHAFKFGFEFLYGIADNNPYNFGNGAINFKTLNDFLLGNVQNGTILLGDPTSVSRTRSYAGFVQDDWRVKPRLTLNLGLRYEYDGRPYERNNYIGNFDPNVNPLTTPAIPQVGGNGLPPMWKATYRNFAPRVGLAWDVRGNGKTVVRAGAGVFYNAALLGEIVDLNPFGANFPSVGTGVNNSGKQINAHTPSQLNLDPTQINWSLAGPVFPANTAVTVNGQTYTGTSCTYLGEPGLVGTATPCSLIAAVDPNYHIPWTVEWNLDVQRAITNKLTVEVAYVANHGREASKTDLNQPPVGSGWNTANAALPGGVSPAAYCAASANDPTPFDHCGISGSKAQVSLVTGAIAANEQAAAPYFSKFPYLQNINQIGNLDRSNYNSLQVTATERASHGLTFLLGYTYSHALDMLSGGSFDNGISGNNADPNFLYANGDNDSRHRFTLSTTYNVPGIKSPLQMLQGWSISPIIAIYSATPWSADDLTNDITGTGALNNASTPFQFWNFTGPRSAFNSGPTPVTQLTGSAALAACQSAAVAPYAGNAQLTALALASLTNIGCYSKNGGILTPPAFGTVGNAGRNIFRGQPYRNVDLSIAKDWKFKERFGAQFRAEIFNLFNRTDLAQPVAFKTGTDPSAGGTFGCGCTTPDGAGMTNAVLGSGAARSIQLGLKLTF
jgi:Carboxypeptidase regulatory-like domain/TonB dependent receptor